MKSSRAPVVVTARVDRAPEQVHACYRTLWRQAASYLDANDPIEIVEERAGELLAWRSRHGAGRVTFAAGPAPDTTDVTVELEAGPIARLFLRRSVRADLQRFAREIAAMPAAATTSRVAAPRPRRYAFPRP